MKNHFKKLFVPFFAVFLLLTIGQIQEVSAQLKGVGGSASTLEDNVSGELSGKLGVGVFDRLKTSSGTSTRTRVRKKKSDSMAKSGKTSNRKPAITKNRKKPVKNPSDDIEDEDYDDFEILTYKPVGNLNTAEKLANEFSTNAADRELLLNVFKIVKVAYEAEAAKKGKKNDVALALTFFIGTCVIVKDDIPEPSDQAFDNLYDTLADALIEDGKVAEMSNQSKQEISDSLVYISGFILSGYMSGKQNNDQDTINIFRTLASISLRSLTQIDPDKMSFNKNGLYIKP